MRPRSKIQNTIQSQMINNPNSQQFKINQINEMQITQSAQQPIHQAKKQNYIQNRNYDMYMNYQQMNQYPKQDQMMTGNYNYRMPMNIYGMPMGMEQGGMFSYSPFALNKKIKFTEDTIEKLHTLRVKNDHLFNDILIKLYESR